MCAHRSSVRTTARPAESPVVALMASRDMPGDGIQPSGQDLLDLAVFGQLRCCLAEKVGTLLLVDFELLAVGERKQPFAQLTPLALLSRGRARGHVPTLPAWRPRGVTSVP